MGEITLQLNSPLTDEQWDTITDVDFDHTDRITFHSNCLWEAIKAKLRHGKSVRIVHMRSRDGLHHWGWVDKKSGDLYDFAQTEVVKHWIQYLKFEGYIRKRTRR